MKTISETGGLINETKAKMVNEKLLKIIEKFRQKKILIIGDIMLDKYIWGDVTRISPEAPVQVVNVIKENYAPGGAANVANNISALGKKTYIVGITGNDPIKDILISELKKRKINVEGIFTDDSKVTIQKVRVFARNQQLLRFDYEKKGYLKDKTEKEILIFINNLFNDIDAIAISDYSKGVITENLMIHLTQLCAKRNKVIVVDPKPCHKEFYRGSTLISPNHKEAIEMAGLAIEENNNENINKIGKKLIETLETNILITRGEKGMSLFEKNGQIIHIPTYAKEVFDIIGAGDTVVASLTLALASGATLKEAAIIANHAAGITVGKIGTTTVTYEELKKSIQTN